LLAYGQLAEADRVLRHARALRERKLPDTLYSATMLDVLAVVLAQIGRPNEANAAILEASNLLAKHAGGPGTYDEIQHRLNLARAYFASGRASEAVQIFAELKPRGMDLSSAPLRAMSIIGLLAEAQFAAGLDRDAMASVTEIRTTLTSSGAIKSIPLLNAKLSLVEGGVRLRAGDAAGAMPLLEVALVERETRLSPASPFLAEAYLWVARGKFALGKRAEAANDVRARNAQLGEHFERQFREVKLLLDAPIKP
jgi:hypothetical protein